MEAAAYLKVNLSWFDKMRAAECVAVIEQEPPVGDIDRLHRHRPFFSEFFADG